jgi:tetratricopeptide (TPR) repeat protein
MGSWTVKTISGSWNFMTVKTPTRINSPEREELLKLVREVNNPGAKAFALMKLGSFDEKQEDWVNAVDTYTKAVEAGSPDPFIHYYANNNLGFSLIQLNRFDDAERYCAAAINIDENRYNAHKNLGLVRQGQERWLEAAFCFAEAYRLCRQNKRSWHLLSALMTAHPEILKQSEELRTRITDLGHQSDEAHYAGSA